MTWRKYQKGVWEEIRSIIDMRRLPAPLDVSCQTNLVAFHNWLDQHIPVVDLNGDYEKINVFTGDCRNYNATPVDYRCDQTTASQHFAIA